MTAAKPTEYTVRQKGGQNYHIISGLGGGAGHVPPVPPMDPPLEGMVDFTFLC